MGEVPQTGFISLSLRFSIVCGKLVSFSASKDTSRWLKASPLTTVILLVPSALLALDILAEFAYLRDSVILLQYSVACVAADLHEGSLESHEFIAYGHHVHEVASHPHLHFIIQVLQRVLTVDFIALCTQDLTKGGDFLLKLHSWANVCLEIDGQFLKLLLEVFECVLEVSSLCQLTVLGRIVYIFILGFLLHELEVSQRFRSVCLFVLFCLW